LTIVAALKLWGARWTGLRITVRCDNEAAVTVVNTGRCRNPLMNSCLRENCFLAALCEFQVCAAHVPGVSIVLRIFFPDGIVDPYPQSNDAPTKAMNHTTDKVS